MHPTPIHPEPEPGPLSRRNLIVGGALGAAMAAGWLPTRARAEERCDLVGVGGRIRAQLVVAPDAPSAVRDVATEFVGYLAQITGVTLPIGSGEPPTELNAVYLGQPGARTARTLRGAALAVPASDGYAIVSGPRAVTVVGGGPYGVVNGVHALLRSLGVEWLLPGTLGEVVPTAETVAVPYGTVASDPVLDQRMLSPLHGLPGVGAEALGNTWAARNALQGWHNAPLAFHHNLWSLFPVADYGATHPEYYANGKVPKPGVQINWQPAFSNPATIEVAVARIISWFDANPGAESFSLGVNDGGGYETGVDPVDAYYRWVNAVASGVTAIHPGKRFGLLAYHAIEPVPSFNLHPSVVPFFTQDRLAWADPATRLRSQQLLRQWREKASALALYDYVYGWPYLVPRLHQSVLADALRFGVSVDVAGLYAELYPNWGEGPKPWLLARLAWDPSADVEALTRHWCRLAVGGAAADHLRAYFAVWERMWTERAVGTPWFLPGATYQDFTSPRYLAAVSADDVVEARSHIDAVLAAPMSVQQRARADLVAKVWEFSEASIVSWPREVPVSTDAVTARTVLDRAVMSAAQRAAAAQRRTELLAEFRTDPLLRTTFDPARFPNLLWNGDNASEFWSVVVYLKQHESSGGPVTDRARELSVFADSPEGRSLATRVVRAAEFAQLTQNPSFETADAEHPDQPDSWIVLPRHTGTRAISRDSSAARTGTAACLSSGTGWGGPLQIVPATPGLVWLSLWCRAAPSSTALSVQLAIDLCDAAGVRIGSSTIRSAVMPVTRDDQWHQLTLSGQVPAVVSGRPVETLAVVPLYDSAGEVTVWTDDVELYVAPTA